MSDIFNEIERDIRQERLASLWRLLAPAAIGLAFLIVAGTATYVVWSQWQQGRSEAAGDTLIETQRLFRAGDFEAANAALAPLAQGPGGYPLLARFAEAANLAALDRPKEAIAAYEAIATDPGVAAIYRDLATVEAAYLALDNESYEAILARVGLQADGGSDWRLAAREILAIAAWKAGQPTETLARAEQILDDPETNVDFAARAQTYRDLAVAAGVSLEEVSPQDETPVNGEEPTP